MLERSIHYCHYCQHRSYRQNGLLKTIEYRILCYFLSVNSMKVMQEKLLQLCSISVKPSLPQVVQFLKINNDVNPRVDQQQKIKKFLVIICMCNLALVSKFNQFRNINFSISIQTGQMSQSKLSKSKTKLGLQSLPSTDILHKGYQRKIAQSEYIKLFPKMRLRINARVNTFNLTKKECTQEFIYEQVENMKEENKKLEQINQELITKIRKETKFNEIYEKKMDKNSIQCMSFEKILQIKLLLDVQELEQQLSKKEEDMQLLIKTNKRKKELIENTNLDPFADLHAVILQNQKEIGHRRQSKQIELKQTIEKLNIIYQDRQKLKNKQRKKGLELNSMKISIQQQNKILPQNQQIDYDINQVSILGGFNRSKNIQQLEIEIQKIQSQSKELQIKFQQQMDNKVKQKLLLMKQLQQYNSKMQKLKIFHKGKSLNILTW